MDGSLSEVYGPLKEMASRRKVEQAVHRGQADAGRRQLQHALGREATGLVLGHREQVQEHVEPDVLRRARRRGIRPEDDGPARSGAALRQRKSRHALR